MPLVALDCRARHVSLVLEVSQPVPLEPFTLTETARLNRPSIVETLVRLHDSSDKEADQSPVKMLHELVPTVLGFKKSYPQVRVVLPGIP